MKRICLLLAVCTWFLTACTVENVNKDTVEEVTDVSAEVQKEELSKEETRQERQEKEQQENVDAGTSGMETHVVRPLPDTMDINNLDSCTAAVSLSEGDAYVDDSGVMQMKVKLFVYDLYDMVDVAGLKAGDALMADGQIVSVETAEVNDYGDVLINGGLDMGGIELRTDDNGVYYLNGYSDVKTWREIGEAVIPVSEEFIYTDSSDLDKDPVNWYAGDFLSKDSGIDYNFTPYNTEIVIEEGMIIAMNRVYTP